MADTTISYTHSDADDACRQTGGTLANLNVQTEFDLVQDWLESSVGKNRDC